MASKVNTKFLLILFIVGGSLFAAMGGFYVYFTRSSAAHNLARADEFAAEGDYRKAFSYYSRALGEDPGNMQYLGLAEGALLDIQPETAGEARELYAQYISILRHAAVHHPTEADKHLRLLDELLGAARRARSWQYTEVMEEAADDMWNRMPSGDSRRIHAKLYQGVASVSPWMQDRRTSEEIAEGERALEEFLAEVPDSDVGWSSLVTARLAAETRLRDASQITRATQAIKEVRETLARARAQVPDGPEVILAALKVSDRDHAVDPTNDDVDAVSMDATRMLQLVRDRDDPWLVSQAAIALERLYWLPNRESAIVVLDEYLAKHPESHELRLLEARLQFARARLDDTATTARYVVESDLLGVGFLSQIQFELKKRALALLVDVAVRRWDEEEAEGKNERVVQIEEAVAALAAMVTDLEADFLLKRARGQLAFARADYAKAAAVFNEILASDVDADYQMKIYAALSLEEIGEYGVAARIFEDARPDQPNNIAVLYHLARLRERLRQYEAADDLADVVLGLEPDHEDAIALKRRIAVALDPAGAMVADPVRRALEEAQVAYRAGTYDLARSTLLAVLDAAPDDLRLLSALARVEVAAGQTDAARTYVKRGLELSPNNRIFLTMIAHLENPDRLEAVKDYIRQTYEDPTQRAVETLLAMRALRLQYDELARRNDTAGRSEQAAANRQEEARSRAEEEAYRAKVAQISPDDPRFIEYRFLRAVEAENWEEAERVVDAATALNIDQAGGLLYRGRYLAGTKDAEAAARAFQKATERIPYSATAWRLLGITLQSLGNHSEALAAFEQSYENNPNDITTVLAYATLLGRLGNHTRMLTVLRKGRRLAPNNDEMREIWLTTEITTGDAAVGLRERRKRYREDPTDVRNAAALATILGRADPVRELLIDEDGEDRFSFERWNRMPAGRREAILAQEQLEWYAEADEIVENLVAPERRDIGWHLLKAELLRDRGDVREGEAVLRGLAEQKTGGTPRLEALLVLGIYQGETGRVDDAIAIFESARALQAPDKLQADIALAEIHFRNRRFEQARQYLEAIVKTRPDRKLNLMLAESLQRLGQYGAALEHLDGVEADGGPDVISLMLRASLIGSQAEEDWAAGRKTEAREGFRRYGETLDRAELLEPANALPHVLRATGWLLQFKQTGEAILLDDALLALSEADEIDLGLQQTSQVRVQILEAKGNLRGAINELRRLVERFPGNDAARQRLVQMLINDRRPQPAIEIVEQAVARDPGAAMWRVALGDLYFASEKMAEIELAGLEDQTGREARAKREQIVRLRIQIDEQYREALRTVPSAPLVLKRAEVLLGATPPAFNDAIDSIELYPDQLAASPLLRAVYARALSESGRRPEAIEHLTASYVQFGEIIDEGAIPPGAIQLWYANLNDVFKREGAGAATEFAMTLCNNQPDAYDLLALSAMWMTRGKAGLSRVIDFVRQGISICPADDRQHRAALYRMLGVGLLWDEQFEESLDAYLKVLEVDPEDPEVLNNVAYLYSESMNDPERGLPYAEDAVRLQPDSGSILDTVGWIYFRLNLLDQAETQLRRSTQLEPTAANLVHLATVLVRKGNDTTAKRYLQRASELNPNQGTRAEIRALADDIRTRSRDR